MASSTMVCPNQMLFQLIDVMYVLLVHMVLKIAANSVVYWIQVGVVRW